MCCKLQWSNSVGVAVQYLFVAFSVILGSSALKSDKQKDTEFRSKGVRKFLDGLKNCHMFVPSLWKKVKGIES